MVRRRRRGEQGEPERGAGEAPREAPCLRTAKSWSRSCASWRSSGRGRFSEPYDDDDDDDDDAADAAEDNTDDDVVDAVDVIDEGWSGASGGSGSTGDSGDSGVTAESRNRRMATVSGQRRRKATASAWLIVDMSTLFTCVPGNSNHNHNNISPP